MSGKVLSEEEWLRWVDQHALMFSMHSHDDDRLFAFWRSCLVAFSFKELCEASTWLLTTEGGRWRTNHVQMIRSRIFDQRKKAIEFEQSKCVQNGPSRCIYCNGLGKICGLPSISCVVNDEWVPPFYPMSVACKCTRGINWLNTFNNELEKANKKIRAIALDEYEALNPMLREQLQEHPQKINETRIRVAVEQKLDSVRPLGDLNDALRAKLNKKG